MGNKNENNSIHWVGLEPVKSEIPPPHQKFLRNFQTTLEYIQTVITALKVTKISISMSSNELWREKKTFNVQSIILKVVRKTRNDHGKENREERMNNGVTHFREKKIK